MTAVDLPVQRWIQGRAVEVTFTVTYRSGTVAMRPVNVKALEMYEGGILKQSFFASRGDIDQTGPSTYRAYIDPRLFTPSTWLVARWIIVHPATGVTGWMDVDVFFTDAPAPAPTQGEYRTRTIGPVASLGEDRHLIAREITRRFVLLLRIFNGSRVAFFLRHRGGKRCSGCWDFDFKRVTDSRCRECWGEGFESGYSNPILGWVFHNEPGTNVSVSMLGERKVQVAPDWWTLPFPNLNEGDFFVKADGSRWRVGQVDTNKMEGEDFAQVTRQVGTVVRVDPDDIIMELPAPDMKRPPTEFVGFLSGTTRTDPASGNVFEAMGTL